MQLKPGSPCVCVLSSLVAEGLWELKQYKDTGFYDISESNRQLPTRHFSNTRVPVVKRQALNQAQSFPWLSVMPKPDHWVEVRVKSGGKGEDKTSSLLSHHHPSSVHEDFTCLQKQDCDLSGTDRAAAGTTDAQWRLLHEGETQEAPDKAALWCVRVRAPWFIERFETVQNKWSSGPSSSMFLIKFIEATDLHVCEFQGHHSTVIKLTNQHALDQGRQTHFTSKATHIPTLILSGQ